jgi:hypothetical protein
MDTWPTRGEGGEEGAVYLSVMCNKGIYLNVFIDYT